ncbi:hypothetical protein KQ940_19185 [Marinobacterium sp. D7]|uniref:hypothetical protein n=1 Tax=Marinobacterium ramblicola TaxID=2849041 RepID=UPI001C2D722B|nr:hypothetical protein [Marinobacterium ramblicola]MBV1790186.1 hypothetical protein [Marinobacterium ramblicola]
MTISGVLPDNKKLCVIYRLEPGCLGPNGVDHIKDFCAFADKALRSFYSAFVIWQVQSRDDKSLPEMEYRVNNRTLPRDKADRYLALMGKNIDEFEEYLHDDISHMIEDYFSGTAI